MKLSRYLPALAALPIASCTTDQVQQRPNIIFILSDDHAAHAISAYGSIYGDVFTTPNIDRLASEGALMRTPFVPIRSRGRAGQRY